jgi:hypothetical protein
MKASAEQLKEQMMNIAKLQASSFTSVDGDDQESSLSLNLHAQAEESKSVPTDIYSSSSVSMPNSKSFTSSFLPNVGQSLLSPLSFQSVFPSQKHSNSLLTCQQQYDQPSSSNISNPSPTSSALRSTSLSLENVSATSDSEPTAATLRHPSSPNTSVSSHGLSTSVSASLHNNIQSHNTNFSSASYSPGTMKGMDRESQLAHSNRAYFISSNPFSRYNENSIQHPVSSKHSNNSVSYMNNTHKQQFRELNSIQQNISSLEANLLSVSAASKCNVQPSAFQSSSVPDPRRNNISSNATYNPLSPFSKTNSNLIRRNPIV